MLKLFLSLLTDFEPVADLHNIKRYAMYFSTHGNFNLIEQDYANDYQYLVRYPNNMALLLIVSLVGRLNYLIFGHYVDFAPVIVNILAINISIMLTAFTAKRLFGNKKGSFCTCFLCIVFTLSHLSAVLLQRFNVDAVSYRSCLSHCFRITG